MIVLIIKTEIIQEKYFSIWAKIRDLTTFRSALAPLSNLSPEHICTVSTDHVHRHIHNNRPVYKRHGQPTIHQYSPLIVLFNNHSRSYYSIREHPSLSPICTSIPIKKHDQWQLSTSSITLPASSIHIFHMHPLYSFKSSIPFRCNVHSLVKFVKIRMH